MKRMLYVLLILQMGATMLFAASLKGESGAKTLYPLPSAIIMNAYRYLGKLQHFSIDAVTTNDDEFHGKMLVRIICRRGRGGPAAAPLNGVMVRFTAL